MKSELILEDFLPYRLSILSNTVSSTIATAYNKRFGLSIPEWRVIAVLGRFPGLSAVEVAERTLMDKVAVSRAVTKLINSGRVDRQIADADRRRSILRLSAEGRQVHDEIAPLALKFEEDLLHGLSEDEIRTLSVIMERLLARARLIGAPQQ
ncbi:MAG: MarR family transcriptional regulator [Proteobacteria bacterium]|nr:MarR family transcriptional regulator [Pseudomonadota bacterium]